MFEVGEPKEYKEIMKKFEITEHEYKLLQLYKHRKIVLVETEGVTSTAYVVSFSGVRSGEVIASVEKILTVNAPPNDVLFWGVEKAWKSVCDYSESLVKDLITKAIITNETSDFR